MNSNGKKVALITGSGRRRVGNVVARSLAENGYSMALYYNSSADPARIAVDELSGVGVDCEAFQANCPESIAAAVQFLVDNQFVTGTCLPVDGGRSIFASETTSRGRAI